MVEPGTYTYWITPAVFDKTLGWRAPDGTVGSIPISAPRQRRAPRWFFVALNPGAIVPRRAVYLGNDLEGDVHNRQRVSEALNVDSLRSVTILGMLWEVLTEKADPDGFKAVRPLMPNKEGRLEIHLGGHSRIASADFDATRHTAVLRNIRRDFEAIRNKVSEEKARRVLGGLAQKYRRHGITARDIAADITPLKPRTRLVDDFTDADGTPLENHTATGDGDAEFGWSEHKGSSINFTFDIEGNQLEWQGSNAEARTAARANFDLSSDDHRASITIHSMTTPTASEVNHGPAVRMNPDMDSPEEGEDDADAYFFVQAQESGGGEEWRLRWIVNGSLFTHETSAHSLNPGDIYTVEADGSTIRGMINYQPVTTMTNTDISGFLRAGLFGFKGGSSGDTVVMDDWEAQDVVMTAAVANAVVPTPQMLLGGAMVLSPSSAVANGVAPAVTTVAFRPTIDLKPCIDTIAVRVGGAENRGGEDITSVTYQRTGGPERTYDTLLIYLDEVSNLLDYRDEWRFMLFGLLPDSEYTVTVTFTSGFQISETATTFTEAPPLPTATGRELYIHATAGDDAQDGLTTNSPKQTLDGENGLNSILQAGDIVNMAGEFSRTDKWSVADVGSVDFSDAVYLRRWEGQAQPIIRGNATFAPLIHIGHNAVIMDGIRFDTSSLEAIKIQHHDSNRSLHYFWLHDVTITDFDLSAQGEQNNAGIQAWCAPRFFFLTGDFFIAHRDRESGDGQSLNSHCVWFGNKQEIENNEEMHTVEIRGNGTSYQMIGGRDSIGQEAEGESTGGMLENCVYSRVWAKDVNDDVFQMEGEVINCAVVECIAGEGGTSTLYGIAIASPSEGPCYLVRNRLWGASEHRGQGPGGVKTGASTWGAYMIHNTIYVPETPDGAQPDGIAQTNDGHKRNSWFLNNAIWGNRYIATWNNKPTDEDPPESWDYNAVYTPDPDRHIQWDSSTKYFNHPDFQAGTGHGGNDVFDLDLRDVWIDPDNGNFEVISGTALHEAGQVIPGINTDVENDDWNYPGSGPNIGWFTAESSGIIAPSPAVANAVVPTPAVESERIVRPSPAVADAVSPTPSVGGISFLSPSPAIAHAVSPAMTAESAAFVATPGAAVAHAVSPAVTLDADSTSITVGAAAANAVAPVVSAIRGGFVAPTAAVAHAVAPTSTVTLGTFTDLYEVMTGRTPPVVDTLASGPLWISVAEMLNTVGTVRPSEYSFDNTADRDEWLEAIIRRAQDRVREYLNRGFPHYDVPEAVKSATLRLAVNLFTHTIVVRRVPLMTVEGVESFAIPSDLFTEDIRRDLRPYRMHPEAWATHGLGANSARVVIINGEEVVVPWDVTEEDPTVDRDVFGASRDNAVEWLQTAYSADRRLVAESTANARAVVASAGNLAPNTDFDTGWNTPSSWTASGAGAQTTTDAYKGDRAIRIVTESETASWTSARFTVSPGDHVFGAWVKGRAETDAYVITVHIYDSTGAVLLTQHVRLGGVYGAYTLRSADVEVPAGAASADIVFQARMAAEGDLKLDRPFMAAGHSITLDRVYWLNDDGTLARLAFTHHDSTKADAIAAEFTARGTAANKRFEVLEGTRIPGTPLRQVRQTISLNESPLYAVMDMQPDEAEGNYDRLADHLCLQAVNYRLASDHDNDQSHLQSRALARLAYGMWDGRGVMDAEAVRDGEYLTYKTALLLIALMVSEETVDGDEFERIERRLWSMQEASGGLVRALGFDGRPVGEPEARATALAVIAYTENMVEDLR